MKLKICLSVSGLVVLAACGKSNDASPAAKPVVEQKDDSPHAKNLPLCSQEERTYVKLDITPGYRYRAGEIKRMIEKSGPSIKNEYLKLAVTEAPYTEQESLLNAWKKVEGDINCTRYQPQKMTNGKPDGAAECLVYTCTFTERATTSEATDDVSAPAPAPVDPNVRITVTGAQYTRDLRYPKLGESYRDPSGLIWGDVFMDSNGQPKELKYEQAEAYCKLISARLPTDDEVWRMAKDFGYDDTFRTRDSYHPFRKGTKETILPHWPDNNASIWAATKRMSGGKRLYCQHYSGSGGTTWSISNKPDMTYTRCVAQTSTTSSSR